MVVSLSQGKLGLRLECPALIAYFRDGCSHCKCSFLYSLFVAYHCLVSRSWWGSAALLPAATLQPGLLRLVSVRSLF